MVQEYTGKPVKRPFSVLLLSELFGQLGKRVQHALRAFTPKDQKAVKTAAQTFRSNPELNTETAITELGVGEALLSFLEENWTPSVVERALICPPQSQIGPITPEQRKNIIQGSVIFSHYEEAVDRESAYEILKRRAEQAAPAPEISYPGSTQNQRQGAGRQRETAVEAMAKSAARAIGSQIGRQIIRGVLGSIFGGRR